MSTTLWASEGEERGGGREKEGERGGRGREGRRKGRGREGRREGKGREKEEEEGMDQKAKWREGMGGGRERRGG